MKKTIKTLKKMFQAKVVLFDGLFYSIVKDNQAIIVRPKGTRFTIEKKIIFA